MATKQSKVNKKQNAKASFLTRFANNFYGLAVWQRAFLFAAAFALVGTSGYLVLQSEAYFVRSANYCLSNDVTVGRYVNNRHDCVATVQTILKQSSGVRAKCATADLDVDARFGAITEAKVKCFQRSSFGTGMGAIKDDGVVGPNTLTKLKKNCWYENHYNAWPSSVWCGGTNPY